MPTKLGVFEGSASLLSHVSLKRGIGMTGLRWYKLGAISV